MQLIKKGDRYIAQTAYEEREKPKAAGFRWDPDRRFWWTADPDRAVKLADHADDACRADLAARQAKQQAAIAASRATSAEVAIPAPAGLDYLPFQRAGIAFASQRPATLIADEMGLGKTIQAIGVINGDEAIKRVLITCPASLKVNWQRELSRWLVRPLTIGIASGQEWPDTDIVVVNYDVLHVHRARIQAIAWDVLVADEAHYLKNPDARRTKQIFGDYDRQAKAWTLAPIKAARRLLLTGTPIVNRPKELFGLISYLDPAAWPNFFNYARRYCDAHQISAGRRLVWDFDGASHLDELQEKLRSTILIRRLKTEVLPELPPKRRQVIELPANGAASAVAAEQRAWLRQQDRIEALQAAVELAKAGGEAAYEDAVAALREGYLVAFTEISRERHAVAVAKVPAVIEFVADVLETGEKLVLFAHHHDVIDALAEHFGPMAVLLTGRESQADRQTAVDRFQADPAVRLFLGSITAAGVGLTLTAASHVLFAELDWVPGNVSQAEDRLHRIGQVQSVLVQHLVLDGSLDARMAKTIVAKQATIDAALDEKAAPPDPRVAVDEKAATARTSRSKIDQVAATLTAEQIAAVHQGLRLLAGICDGAQSLDDLGFDKLDTRVGKSLAESPALTPKQAALGRQIIAKYHRQVGVKLLAAAGVETAAKRLKGAN